MRELHSVVARHREALGAYWARCDVAGLGHVTLPQWNEGLRSVCNLQIDWTAFCGELGVPQTHGNVHWIAFLGRYQERLDDTLAAQLIEVKKRIRERLSVKSGYFGMLSEAVKNHPDGLIPLSEVTQYLHRLGLDIPAEAIRICCADIISDSKLNMLEHWRTVTPAYSGPPIPPDVRELFETLDAEFAADPKNVLALFRELDVAGTGRIGLEGVERMVVRFSQRRPEYAKYNDRALAQRVMWVVDPDRSGHTDLMEVLKVHFAPRGPAAPAGSGSTGASPGTTGAADQVIWRVLRSIAAHHIQLNVIFQALDVRGDGLLPMEQFRAGLRALALVDGDVTDAELDLVAAAMDHDGDGLISRKGFLAAFEEGFLAEEGDCTRHVR